MSLERARALAGRGLRAVALVAALVASDARASDPALPIAVPPGFSVEVFASGLGGPRGLAVDSAGTLVASIPSRGRVVALPDRGPGQIVEAVTLAARLQLPHGVAFRQGDLYVAETGRIVRFRYNPQTLAARDPAVVVAGLPAGAHHWTRSIAFGRDGRLYVAIGSSCDICRERDPRRASIVRYEPDGSGERLFASGLRNPVGLAVQPRTGILWTAVNERDWQHGGAPPDYVTELRDGGAYGWPDCYAEGGAFAPDPELRDRRACRGLTAPTLELPPHSAPLGLAFYTGMAFPPPYRESLFVALHGSRLELPEAGYKILRIALSAGRPAQIEDFATGWRSGTRVWGRPVDVVTGRDGALYVSDDHGDRIVRIMYRPR